MMVVNYSLTKKARKPSNMLTDVNREMWDLFNVNDAKGLNVFEVENGIVDMTQTGDSFDRWAVDV